MASYEHTFLGKEDEAYVGAVVYQPFNPRFVGVITDIVEDRAPIGMTERYLKRYRRVRVKWQDGTISPSMAADHLHSLQSLLEIAERKADTHRKNIVRGKALL